MTTPFAIPRATKRVILSAVAGSTPPAPSRPIEATMPLFWKPYKSEVSSFIDELKAKKPTLEAEQLAGRALLWDKQIDREQQSEYKEAAVAQQPYVYQTHVK
jgi:hypothetical protein